MSKIGKVTLFPTTRCDRGCRHCLMGSTMKGEDMTVDMIMEIIDWIARSKIDGSGKPQIGLTGGGEPLLNRQLPEIIGALVDAGCHENHIPLVTSGCLPNSEESAMFERIIDEFGQHISLSLSFHLFQPTFPQRLEHTLKMAIKCHSISQVAIKMTVFDDSFAVHQALSEVFFRLNITDIRGTTIESLLRSGKSPVLQNEISKNHYENRIPDLFATLVHTIHFAKDKPIIVYPQCLSGEGRGARFFSLEDTDFCTLFDASRQEYAITIPPSGRIRPSEDARCHNQKPLFIGNIREHDFKEILRRRKAAHGLMKGLMADPSELPVCELCQSEMFRQGLVSA